MRATVGLQSSFITSFVIPGHTKILCIEYIIFTIMITKNTLFVPNPKANFFLERPVLLGEIYVESSSTIYVSPLPYPR